MRARLVLAGFGIALCALLPGSASAVLGGQPDTSHPYVVMIADGQNLCSGTLLSSTVVLTAAHCFSNDGQGASLRVYIAQQPQPGDFTTGTYYFDPQFAGIGTGTPHADTHDVAVVIFTTPIPSSATDGQYGALPSPGLIDTLKNPTVDVVGYGVQGFARGGGQPQAFGGANRNAGQTTLITANDAISGEFAKLHTGICFGDSGGPDLQSGTNVVLAENSFLNNGTCAGDTYSYRVDTPAALTWIATTVAAHGGSL